MIPKIIHYCWFGRNPLPKSAKNCINSWKRFDLYGWISLMSQLIIINRALYVNKQQEGKICAIT